MLTDGVIAWRSFAKMPDAVYNKTPCERSLWNIGCIFFNVCGGGYACGWKVWNPACGRDRYKRWLYVVKTVVLQADTVGSDVTGSAMGGGRNGPGGSTLVGAA